MKRNLSCTALFMASMWLSTADADMSVTADKPTASNRDESSLEEIVVTAEKRKERLIDVAVAVTAIGHDDIQNLGAKTLFDLAPDIPGLAVVSSVYSQTQIIRGITSTGGNAPLVGYYLDDAPIQQRGQDSFFGNSNIELYDLDHVEVLRGPQGTLYGGSAMGGIIRFVSPEPSLTKTEGRVTAELVATDGGQPGYSVGGAVGTPLLDETLGMRASAYVHRVGGYIDRVDSDTDQITAHGVNDSTLAQTRVALEWKLNDAFTFTPSFFFQGQQRGDLDYYSSKYAPALDMDYIPQRGHDYNYLPSISAAYDLGSATLTSVTSYYARDFSQIFDYSALLPGFSGEAEPPAGYYAYNSREYTQRVLSEELRLVSHAGGRFDYLAGFYFRRHAQALVGPIFESQAFAPFGLPAGLIYNEQDAETEKEIAIFGEASYLIVNNLKLTLGARVSRSTFHSTTYQSGPLNGPPIYNVGSEGTTPVTPKASLSYNLSPDSMVYLSATKGFRDGSINGPIAPINAACVAELAEANATGLGPKSTYGPDYLWSYELGWKSELLDHRLNTAVSVFQINWKDIQSQVVLPECGGAYTLNFGAARSRGAEFELNALPINSVKFHANVSYTDAAYTSDIITTEAGGAQNVFARSGDPIFGLHWSGATNLTYTLRLTSDVQSYWRVDYQYIGSRLIQPAVSGRYGYNEVEAEKYGTRYPAYSYYGVRAGIALHSWDISVFSRNLSNARPLTGVDPSWDPVNLVARETTIPPRLVGITVERKF
jgi:iron complex outermembrane receptor protein